MSNSAAHQLTMSIEGMGCQGCVATVTQALQSIPGVTAVKVDLDAQNAKITVGNPPPSNTLLTQAIEKAGYTPGPIQ